MTVFFASAAPAPVVLIDGTPLSISSALGTPYIDSANRLQVPIRAISEKLGASVSWDQNSTTATIDGTIKVKVGSSTMTTAYGTITMDTSAANINGRIYVPIRFIANALGYDVVSTTANGSVSADIITKV